MVACAASAGAMPRQWRERAVADLSACTGVAGETPSQSAEWRLDDAQARSPDAWARPRRSARNPVEHGCGCPGQRAGARPGAAPAPAALCGVPAMALVQERLPVARCGQPCGRAGLTSARSQRRRRGQPQHSARHPTMAPDEVGSAGVLPRRARGRVSRRVLRRLAPARLLAGAAPAPRRIRPRCGWAGATPPRSPWLSSARARRPLTLAAVRVAPARGRGPPAVRPAAATALARMPPARSSQATRVRLLVSGPRPTRPPA